MNLKLYGTGWNKQKVNILLLAATASIFVIVGGYIFFKSESNRIRNEKYLELKAIADLKESQLRDWRKERFADAHHFSISPLYSEALENYIKSKDTALERSFILRNRMIKNLRGFATVFIATPDYKMHFVLDTAFNYYDPHIKEYIDSALINKKIYFSDFYFHKQLNQIYLAIISPINNKQNKPIATLVFVIDPNSYIYKAIQQWPTPSKISETLIVKREGDSVVFLNKLRNIENSNQQFKLSLSNKSLPATQAVLGHTGFFIGKDYSGKDVISDLRQIPEMPWFMVTKVDMQELFLELHFRVVVIVIIVFVLIMFIIAGVGWIYYLQKGNIYKELLIKETNLSKVEEEFRITLYSVGDGVITTDIYGNVKRMNREAEQITGYTECEAQGKPLEEIFKIIDEGKRESIENPVAKVLKEGLVLGLANHSLLITKEGREIPIADSAAPIKNEKGKIFGVVLVFKDQTRERNVQRALMESQQQMTHIIEFLPDAIFAIDRAGRVIAWNKAIQEMTGVPASEMIGKSDYEYALPFFGERHPILVDFVFKDYTDQVSNYDFLVRVDNTVVAESSKCTVNGKHIIFYGKASPLYNSKGEIVGAIELIRDITASRKNEQLLREKDVLFKSLLEFSPIYIFFKDHDIRAIHLSKNYEKMLGMPLSDILGKTMDELFPSDLAKSMVADDKKILYEGKLIEVDEELNGKYYTTIKFPIFQDGHPPVLAGFTIDITDRKKAEQELIKALERAERSDKLKDAFLQNMSHEIRTPMNAITGFSALLSDEGITPERIAKYTEIIINSSNQLLSIVDDILTVSRIQTGQEVFNAKPVNINTIIDDLHFIFKTRFEDKNLEFSNTKFFSNNESVILTDRTKLTQILTNLISNALKFTHQGSVKFGYSLNDKFLQFFVKDTGIGIKPEMQEIIFERFAQADNINRKYGGTGLGLAISKAYAKILGGDIWVESEPNKGATFYLTIPHKPVHETEISTIPVIDTMNKPMKKILVAEDEFFNFELIREMLLKFDYEILHAKNGEEAVEICEQDPSISLVLMDIKMPVKDGASATVEIKKLRPKLPIIAQTAYALESEKEKFMKNGFDDYITKPINKNDLITKILKYI
jgi:PAS domain S-box-containing protein